MRWTMLISLLTLAYVHATQSACMIPLSEALKEEPLPPFLERIDGWLRKFIIRPVAIQNVVGNRHKADGSLVTQEEFDRRDRAAHVCPFIADSLDRNQFWIERSAFTKDQTPQIAVRLNELMEEFVNTPPAYDPKTNGKPAPNEVISKTFLLYFPNFGNVKSYGSLREIDELHKTFKPIYMERGLGLGQFYPGCPVTGVYTDEKKDKTLFRPLVGPVVAFAVRYLAIHDNVFNKVGSEHRALYEKFFPPPV